MTKEQFTEVARQLAAGGTVSNADHLVMFVGSMVAEAHRNAGTNIGNRLALAGFNGDIDGAPSVFGHMPMTDGDTVKGPRDRSLDGMRSGSAMSAGVVTDQEIAMMKAAFEKDKKQPLPDFIDKQLADPSKEAEVKKEIKDAIRRQIDDSIPDRKVSQ